MSLGIFDIRHSCSTGFDSDRQPVSFGIRRNRTSLESLEQRELDTPDNRRRLERFVRSVGDAGGLINEKEACRVRRGAILYRSGLGEGVERRRESRCA